MKRKTTATELRANLYGLLDRVALSGEPIELIRKGVRLKIIRDEPSPRLSRLKRRDTIIGSPEALLGPDWSATWIPDVP